MKAEYERQAREKYASGDYYLKGLNDYAQVINIVLELNTPKHGKVLVVSGWNVNPNGNIKCNTPARGGKNAKVR